MVNRITYRPFSDQMLLQDGGTGARVLVDRVWPQGIRRRGAPLEWLSGIAPSTELQDWYSRHPARFDEFRCRYLTELADRGHRQATTRLRNMAARGSLTLLTATQDVDHSHAAVIAEWLTDGVPRDARGTDAPGPQPGHAHPSPPSSGHRATVSAAVTNLNAGALSFVMGTGIVSTALHVNGADTVSAALLWTAVVGFAVLVPAYGWRMLRRRQRFAADFLGPRAFAFLTVAVSSNVLAARLVPDGRTMAAGAFLTFGALGWLILDYGVPIALITTVKREPSLDQVNGTWFLWAVGSESVAVAAASLAPATPGRALAVVAGVCWGIGLIQYLLTAAIVLTRLLARPVRPQGLMTSVWIFMGAAAITVLAAVRLMALPADSTLLRRPLLEGAAVVLWAFSSWLIPLLLALGAWRHVLRRVPLRYDVGWWNLVFPIGMYAVTTHELGRATATSWMTSAGRWEVWVAGLVWAVVFAAMAAAPVRRRSTSRKEADAGRTQADRVPAVSARALP
ncbi:DUF488 family protein, N3 subclade [Streptomyces sediminimaris]|uniref:SLAC1 family transporter n=1 Tax=Streptomyces sediminimaris TaxID=3383721 RepID=UPI00399959EA